ncbi:MAG: hypothetical protein AAFV95_15095 [Bacteroidota bacterium]
MLKKGTHIFLGLALLYLGWTYTPAGEYLAETWYDWTTDQQPIWTQNDIDSVLNQLPTLAYDQLDAKYRKYIQSIDPEQANILEGQRFYVVSGQEIFRYIAGDFRIRDFLPRDSYFYRSLRLFSINRDQYWLVDRQLLYKVLELQNLLYRKGFNQDGFTIVEGFRHPRINVESGGTAASRHLLGQAVELEIGDINGNGKADKEDKDLLLGLLEEQIIGDMGGIGHNPGTMSVHFDVRGYKARWAQE